MDDPARTLSPRTVAPRTVAPRTVAPPLRPAVRGLLAVTLVVVAALILAPVGAGWSWGSPVTEVRWYLTGLGSAATRLQLAGNLGLLVVPAGLAVLLWRPLRRPHLLVGAAIAAGVTIELLQWVLPLGRVVSPLDAALNAAGAVAGGLLVRAWSGARRGGGDWVRRPREEAGCPPS